MPSDRRAAGLFQEKRPAVIGMVHLPPLPGAPGYGGGMEAVLEAARADADALIEGGVDAVLLENFNDVPFFKTEVPRITVAAMTRVALEVKSAAGPLPVGVNVLRNDGRAALAVAIAAGCDFIRVNVLCGARVTDQGVIEGIAAELLRDRAMLGGGGGVGGMGGSHVQIWADVDVKHSAPLAERPVEDEVADTIHRGRADAVIVSGTGTGKATDPQTLRRVKAAAGQTPVLVGSGVTLDSVPSLTDADGLIVGTALKREGAVDGQRVRALVAAVRVED